MPVTENAPRVPSGAYVRQEVAGQGAGVPLPETWMRDRHPPCRRSLDVDGHAEHAVGLGWLSAEKNQAARCRLSFHRNPRRFAAWLSVVGARPYGVPERLGARGNARCRVGACRRGCSCSQGLSCAFLRAMAQRAARRSP
ncbi:MAG: hypothetical protein ACLU0O_06360 [Collinsella sp.]